MMRRLPDAVVTVAHDPQVDQVVEHAATILFVSPYESGPFSKHDYKHVILSIQTWTQEHDLRLIVRPHPSEGAAFWQSQFPEIPIDTSVGGLNGAISQHGPLLIVGWWSTSLLDALKAGVLPVLIMSGSEAALEDMAFPLAEVALNWPRDENLIHELTSNDKLYCKELTIRQDAAFGTLTSGSWSELLNVTF